MECFENKEARTANYGDHSTEAPKLNCIAVNRAVLKELNSNNENNLVSERYTHINQRI